MTATAKPTFSFAELNRRVRRRLPSRAGGWQGGTPMIQRAIALLLACGGCYAGVLLLGPEHPLLATASLMLLTFTSVVLELSIMHEASHRSLSGRPWLDRLLAHTLTLMGLSVTLWHRQHVQSHHASTNVEGEDPDIDQRSVLRLSPAQPWHPWHRWQHCYAWPCYVLSLLHWVWFADVADLVHSRTVLPRRRWWALAAEVVLSRMLHAALFLGLPLLSYGDPWIVLLGYLAYWLCFGFVVAVIFQLAHVSGVQQFPASVDREDWALHQLRTTADFAPRRRWLTWCTGGLNMQVVHHVFPGLSQVHYPLVQGVLRDYCAETGVEYHVFQGVWAAVRGHHRHLRVMGRRPDIGARRTGEVRTRAGVSSCGLG